MTPPADILRRAKALISDPKNWYKGGFRSQYNRNCMCVIAAFQYVCANEVDQGRIYDDILRPSLPPVFRYVSTFNDHPDTTHDDMMAFMDRAIANAEAGE